MTNYNDGKWNGWNGGDCPVHPETVVQYVLDNSSGPHTELAEGANWAWDSDHMAKVVAFRVIKEHKDPREFWLYYSRQIEDWLVVSDKDSAEMLHYPSGDIIHVREVLE